MRVSEIISSIRSARLPDKTGARLLGVNRSGEDIALPYPHAGWVNIADGQYTSGAPLAIADGVKTWLTIDGNGATTNIAYANGLPSDIWSSNTFKPGGLGDAYNVRLTFTIVHATAGSGDFAVIDADIGTDAVPFLSASLSIPLIKGGGVPTLVTAFLPFFCLETFGRNGCRFFITPSLDVSVYGAAIFIQRTFAP